MSTPYQVWAAVGLIIICGIKTFRFIKNKDTQSVFIEFSFTPFLLRRNRKKKPITLCVIQKQKEYILAERSSYLQFCLLKEGIEENLFSHDDYIGILISLKKSEIEAIHLFLFQQIFSSGYLKPNDFKIICTSLLEQGIQDHELDDFIDTYNNLQRNNAYLIEKEFSKSFQ